MATENILKRIDLANKIIDASIKGAKVEFRPSSDNLTKNAKMDITQEQARHLLNSSVKVITELNKLKQNINQANAIIQAKDVEIGSIDKLFRFYMKELELSRNQTNIAEFKLSGCQDYNIQLKTSVRVLNEQNELLMTELKALKEELNDQYDKNNIQITEIKTLKFNLKFSIVALVIVGIILNIIIRLS